MDNQQTIELLEKVKAHILEHPDQFDMADWIHEADGKFCTACIGGWLASFALNKEPSWNMWHRDGGRVVVNSSEYLSVYDWIFYVDEWPDKFADTYSDLESDEEKAEIAAQMIDRYIEELKSA